MSIEKLSEIRLYYKPKKETRPKISCSEDAYKQALKFFDKNTIALQEQFIVLYLNRANMVLGAHQVSTGGITGTVADIRIILGVALKAGACGIILSHNHPSGNLNASAADKELTSRIKQAAQVMDINLMDHIIISPYEGSYFSFADEGLI
ncbi:MAG: RadC family protein [Sphingobacteriales bacterium]|jgi:DNA repair protein RadC